MNKIKIGDNVKLPKLTKASKTQRSGIVVGIMGEYCKVDVFHRARWIPMWSGRLSEVEKIPRRKGKTRLFVKQGGGTERNESPPIPSNGS